MKSNFILWDTIEQKLVNYPRNDDDPVVGLDSKYQVLKVVREDIPEFSEEWDIVQEISIDLDSAECRYQWVLTPKIDEPNWNGFKNSLLSHPEVNSMLISAMAILPSATISLPTSISNFENSGNIEDFKFIWTAMRRSGLISSDLLQIVQDLAENNHLPEKFIDILSESVKPIPTTVGQEWTDDLGQSWVVVQARLEDGTFIVDDIDTPENESLIWEKVEV